MPRTSTQEQLLRAAERLFALDGVDAVSMRRICAEAGQRNKTALQYHFGDKESLLQAIFEDRMAVLNERRQALLDAMSEEGKDDDLRSLVFAFVHPFAEQLNDVEGGCHYIRLSAQLFSQGRAISMMGAKRPWNRAVHAIVTRIQSELDSLPKAVVTERLKLMAGQLVHATASKACELGTLSGKRREKKVEEFSRSLVDYVIGGLMAEVSK